MTTPSTMIGGRYLLEQCIREGGMGAVWRAKDTTLERNVAVKLLFERRDPRERATEVDRFLREARLAASVHHRNVVQILDFGTTETGTPFMVMEFLEGETLGDRLNSGPPLSVEKLIHTITVTLRGLTVVHDVGIIHRDLKPENIFLVRDADGSFPKLLDFGISRSVESSSGKRSPLTTMEGFLVGTPHYMSPEQARGIKDIDKRTDIYSMGVILYEALTGKLPFDSENLGDLIILIASSNAPSVFEMRPEVGKHISNVVSKAMSREREGRYADARELQKALMRACEETFGAGTRPSLSVLPRPLRSSIPPSREINLDPIPSKNGNSPIPPTIRLADPSPVPEINSLSYPRLPAGTDLLAPPNASRFTLKTIQRPLLAAAVVTVLSVVGITSLPRRAHKKVTPKPTPLVLHTPPLEARVSTNTEDESPTDAQQPLETPAPAANAAQETTTEGTPDPAAAPISNPRRKIRARRATKAKRGNQKQAAPTTFRKLDY